MAQEQVQQDIEAGIPTPWGFWATIGFSIVILLVSTLSIGILVAILLNYAKSSEPAITPKYFFDSVVGNGFIFSLSTFISAPLFIGLSVLLARVKKEITVTEYLCVHKINGKVLFKWTLTTILLLVVWDSVMSILKLPDDSHLLISWYNTSNYLPLLWFAFLVAAPLSEEIFFRGFLFRGIQASKLGVGGALVITSLAWTSLHTQYNSYGMLYVFVLGLLLGYARFKTNSIFTTIVLHSLVNLYSILEIAFSAKSVS